MFTLVKTSPTMLYSRLSSHTLILRLVIVFGGNVIALSGVHSYGCITLAGVPSRGGTYYGHVYLVKPSEDELQLILVPGQACPFAERLSTVSLAGSAVKWGYSHQGPQHLEWGSPSSSNTRPGSSYTCHLTQNATT